MPETVDTLKMIGEKGQALVMLDHRLGEPAEDYAEPVQKRNDCAVMGQEPGLTGRSGSSAK